MQRENTPHSSCFILFYFFFYPKLNYSPFQPQQYGSNCSTARTRKKRHFLALFICNVIKVRYFDSYVNRKPISTE